MKIRNCVGAILIIIALITAGVFVNSCSSNIFDMSASYTISGYIYDASYPYGKNIGIKNAMITYGKVSVYSDAAGKFEIQADTRNPLLTITAPGFHMYKEKPSRMINGGFHLIPEEIYRGVYLIVWNKENSNPNNYLRKWEEQTAFVIVKAGATNKQVDKILEILASDEYKKMTGGRFTSSTSVEIVDKYSDIKTLQGKTIISFQNNIVSGGIAHSDSQEGIINHAEITWDVNQEIDAVILWHEMVHTVTAGGHINEWPSVVSEIQTAGKVTDKDEKIMNCIYNSPPMRKAD